MLELLNNNKSLNFNDIKHFAQRNSWSREKVFSFVSHQNVVENKSFPCNTLRGSKTGKPCSFPFIYEWSMTDQADNTSVATTQSVWTGCTPLDDVTPWCYTRVLHNLSSILGM